MTAFFADFGRVPRRLGGAVGRRLELVEARADALGEEVEHILARLRRHLIQLTIGCEAGIECVFGELGATRELLLGRGGCHSLGSHFAGAFEALAHQLGLTLGHGTNTVERAPIGFDQGLDILAMAGDDAVDVDIRKLEIGDERGEVFAVS